MPPLNRSAMSAAMSGNDIIAAGNVTMAPGGVGGGTIRDITPQRFLARLTGQRIGAAYGWEKVWCQADLAGRIGVTAWTGEDANYGTPTNLPAIDPNGTTDIAPGSVVYITPVEQGGTYQYVMESGSAPRGGYPYGYSSGVIILDAITIPVYQYRCSGTHLQESVQWWLISAPGISATVSNTNPNLTGRSSWWCMGGQCIESTEPPAGFNSGPYTTQSACAANCI